jgi:hypothetical protein
MVDHKEIDKRTVMCHVNRHMKVIRRKTSKWYVSPEEYSKNYYYKYCSGSGKTLFKIYSQNLGKMISTNILKGFATYLSVVLTFY